MAKYDGQHTESGHRAVVRSCYHRQRQIQTGIGAVTAKIPKIRSTTGEPVTFRSCLIPSYVRKTRTLEAFVPWLYLKGISSGEMGDVLGVLLDLKARGMNVPKLAVGDGALGFWSALDEIYPDTRHQRCWVQKSANVLNALPKSAQPKAKEALHEIWMVETRADAQRALDKFIQTYQDKYPKATQCLEKDREELLAFYDFPAVHWLSLRTTNPIESTFATIRHRTRRSKGCLRRKGMLCMMFKLGICAQHNWRRLRGFRQLGKVIEGIQFKDGIETKQFDNQVAA